MIISRGLHAAQETEKITGKRRGNGEGSIRRRSDGRWEARISLDGGHTKSAYAKTRAEAAQKLTMLLRDRDRGLPIVKEQQTVATYFPRWLETIKPTIKPKTHLRYAQLVHLHVLPAIGRVRLARLQPHHLQELYADMLNQQLAPSTVRQLHAVIHRALDDAEKVTLVPRNVADLVKPPRIAKQEMHILTREQATELLDVVAGDPLEALYVLALTTGMRQGELLGLRWRDIDLEGRALHVTRALQHHRGSWTLEEPKSARSRRRIQLAPTAVDTLRRHRATQSLQRLELGPAWADHDLVFTRADGEPLRGSHITDMQFYPLLKRAGLPRIRFHDLRHTAATLLLLSAIHPKIVSEMLGHSNVAITLNVYSHVLPDMQRDAAAAMERMLSRG